MIVNNNYKYHLAKKGKWVCPECGRKTFVCYVDDNGNVLNESVGKCDRADNCNYHKPPREYFKENGSESDRRTFQTKPRMTFQRKEKPNYINKDLFKRSLREYGHNNLIKYLIAQFDGAGLSGADIVNKMISDYFVGTSKHWDGATAFWQIDINGNIHRGKIMQYNPDTGKRVKEPFSKITSVHSVMKLPDPQPNMCFFGEHLIGRNPTATIAIVESEKTAMIANVFFHDAVVVACGGCGNLTKERCAPLYGRDVVLLPDNGKYAEWSRKKDEIRPICRTIRINDIMEYAAENNGDDIADLFIEHVGDYNNDVSFRKYINDHLYLGMME